MLILINTEKGVLTYYLFNKFFFSGKRQKLGSNPVWDVNHFVIRMLLEGAFGSLMFGSHLSLNIREPKV